MPLPSRPRRRHGFSLLELMVVIVIIAVAATGVTFGIGALTKSRLRSGAVRVMAACRYGYHRAISRGSTVRVVFDLDANTISLEEAHGRVTLTRADEDGASDGEGVVDPWTEAQRRLSERLEPSIGASPFSVLSNDDGEPLERYRPHEVASGIRIVELRTPHEQDPRTSGRGAIYFFPNGTGERAFVRLEDARRNQFVVEIAELTGRGIIHDGDFEPPGEGDERAPRDPG